MTPIDSTYDRYDLMILLMNVSYLRLHVHINYQNTHQRKNLKLPYLYSCARNICEVWKVKRLEFIRERLYSLINVENY